jgi:hypothetical protein
MSMSDELQKLEELHRRGALSDEEFAQAKALVLGGTPPNSATARQDLDPTVDPDRDVTPGRLRVMQLLAFALLLGLVIFLGISLFIVLVTNNGQGLAPPQDLPLVSLVAGMMLVVCAPLSFVLPRIMTQAAERRIAAGTWQVPPGIDPGPYRTTGSMLVLLCQSTMLVGLAQLEGAAFTGCMAYLLEGRAAVLAVPGVAILLMLGRFPTEGRVRAWLERRAEVLAELRGQCPDAGRTRKN